MFWLLGVLVHFNYGNVRAQIVVFGSSYLIETPMDCFCGQIGSSNAVA